jgi:hypothetical protein
MVQRKPRGNRTPMPFVFDSVGRGHLLSIPGIAVAVRIATKLPLPTRRRVASVNLDVALALSAAVPSEAVVRPPIDDPRATTAAALAQSQLDVCLASHTYSCMGKASFHVCAACKIAFANWQRFYSHLPVERSWRSLQWNVLSLA